MKFQTLFLFKCVTFSVSYALNPKNSNAGFKFRRDIPRVLEENMINIIFMCFVKLSDICALTATFPKTI